MLPTKRAATAAVGFLLFLSGSFASSFHTQSVARRPSVRNSNSRSGPSRTRPPLTSSNDSNDKADTNPAQDVPRGGGPLNGEMVPSIPTLTQYRQFALPCLALWVAGPLLSLVDTTFIGLSGPAGQSAQQLAALGPATTFFDGAQYLFAFLNVATTNLYSSARAQAGEDSAKAESVVRTAARVSFKCGLGIMFFLFACGRPLLSLYIGEQASATPGLLDAATDYVKIRALSLPTSLLLGVLQAALLGSKDSVTPLIAILYSTLVNVAGDYLLVSRLKWGLQGAAIATTAAQWASTAAMIGPARRKLVKDHVLGFLQTKREMKEGDVTGRAFLSFAAPVLILILGKLAAFGFMTHAAAAVPGQPTPLASHQILLTLLFIVAPFLEVISQTAQTFLPPFIAPASDYIAQQQAINPAYQAESDPQVTEWLTASKKVATSLLGIGITTATIVASIVSLVPAFFGNFITSDPTVQTALQPLAKYLWMGAFFWAPVAVAEGVLLARRELGFLAGVYLVSTALLPPALLRIKFRQGTVAQVWACFAVFQLFRAICFSSKIWVLPFLKRMLGGKHQATVTTESVSPVSPESPESPVSPESPMPLAPPQQA
jgi:Na+-driven multidrug efflux pump